MRGLTGNAWAAHAARAEGQRLPGTRRVRPTQRRQTRGPVEAGGRRGRFAPGRGV